MSDRWWKSKERQRKVWYPDTYLGIGGVGAFFASAAFFSGDVDWQPIGGLALILFGPMFSIGVIAKGVQVGHRDDPRERLDRQPVTDHELRSAPGLT